MSIIIFTAYTPYFNDGNACTYHVNNFDVYLKSEGGCKECFCICKEDEPYKSECFNYHHGEYNNCSADILNDLERIESIPGDLYKMFFGDHIIVKVTPDGFEIDYYEHS